MPCLRILQLGLTGVDDPMVEGLTASRLGVLHEPIHPIRLKGEGFQWPTLATWPEIVFKLSPSMGLPQKASNVI